MAQAMHKIGTVLAMHPFVQPLRSRSLTSTHPSLTTVFREDQYIKELNRVLREEYIASSLYTYWQKTEGQVEINLQNMANLHRKWARELVTLIVSVSGLPICEKEVGLSPLLTMAQIGAITGEVLSQRFFRISSQKIEENLLRSYGRLSQIAPQGHRAFFRQKADLILDYLPLQ